MESMTTYLTTLISEKGLNIHDEINIDGCIGLTWNHLIEFIESAKEYHSDIKTMLVKIDFHNGDVFDYLLHLAKGMIKAMGLDHYIE